MPFNNPGFTEAQREYDNMEPEDEDEEGDDQECGSCHYKQCRCEGN